jgi:putative FmdB family regulatory protein
MPLYEYVCADCESKFEELRPLGRMDDPASCPKGHATGQRVLSVFAAMSRDATGDSIPMGGSGNGCGGSCGTNCACSLN